ncbi:hypothetical protein QOZ88_09270 [Blastococcus sp. BMG 814]|uniref:Glycosyltransferase family 29 (Sialyltransferase) n=1 Tax=Blastococcus carthaginiensis TaxID=3050034 RepID=A0ABT9ICG8_9ACTN|nr:hypothetical protein [Blastococcus carthaginiensis]MDP5182830.1 hypothetical protein [Blastococcus carthaginiensis]
MGETADERRRNDVRELVRTYARERRVRSIAVLGNKPLAPSAERADAVDSCDLVIRVNSFRLDEPGEPPTYGRRVDTVFFHRGLVATRWFFEDYQDRLYLLVEPGRLHWEREALPDWWPTDLGQVHLSNQDLTLRLSAELGLDSRRDGVWSTTGTMAAWWARDAFPDARLELAGYSFVDDPAQTSWSHAAGSTTTITAEHRLSEEATLLRRWLDEGRARVWA